MASLAARFSPGEAPPPEFELTLPSSYAVDPEWQNKFTIIWTSVMAFTTLMSVPWVVRAWRARRLYAGLAIRETLKRQAVTEPTVPAVQRTRSTSALARAYRGAYALWQSFCLWSVPLPTLTFWKSQVADCCRRSYLSLGVAQALLVACYVGTVIACFVASAELWQNSNRAGFIAVASLPLIILLSVKSPFPLPVFLPSLSYEHYNFLHRWAGRTMWLASTVHGSLWLHQFISTKQWSQVKAEKTVLGCISYAMMCMVVITSLKPVRRKFYQLFWIAHILFVVGLFTAIGYHTPYAFPWYYPCIALYGYDQVVRFLRYRLKDATLVPVDPTLTLIHIPDCDAGWLPTQHVFIRVFRGAGLFEAHPFTITNAPPNVLGGPRGITLYAKVAGDWTRRLHNIASDCTSIETGDDYEEREAFIKAEAEGKIAPGHDHPGRCVTVMIDGPYGGLKMDLGEYETVLVVAGGSGVTFLLGTIEEALSRRKAGKGPDNVDVAWVVRDMSTILALAPTLAHLDNVAKPLGVNLTYSLYITDPPFPLPPVPEILPESTTLSPYRPEVAQLVRAALPGGSEDAETASEKPPSAHGGLAVVAAGPEGLVMEARNAVAGISVGARVNGGGIGFHAEVYQL
ncbi:hypothetical protein Q8F55_001299 [Vanrija albida]|uniref:FAD-binding FR-type domain-containing protein n=1 Tax=Vanrija albida TaxID=181172 RepID=A0ABR3QFU6_9TREE